MSVPYLIFYLSCATLLGAVVGFGTAATLRLVKVRSVLAHGALGAAYGLFLAFALSAAVDGLGTAHKDDDVEVEMPILACVSLGILSSLLVRLTISR